MSPLERKVESARVNFAQMERSNTHGCDTFRLIVDGNYNDVLRGLDD
jgi:hypothetical protein